MRRPVIVGNWKMFNTQAETRAFFEVFKPLVAASTHCDIVVGPPFTALAAAVEAAARQLHHRRGAGRAAERARARLPAKSPCAWSPRPDAAR